MVALLSMVLVLLLLLLRLGLLLVGVAVLCCCGGYVACIDCILTLVIDHVPVVGTVVATLLWVAVVAGGLALPILCLRGLACTDCVADTQSKTLWKLSCATWALVLPIKLYIGTRAPVATSSNV